MDTNQSNSPENTEGDSLESTDAAGSLESVSAGTEASGEQPNAAAKTGKLVEKSASKAQEGSYVQRLIRHLNIYLVLFLFLITLAGAIVVVGYLASKKAQNNSVKTQSLSDSTLKQLATSDVTVGQPKQVLSVQSNAVFAGKVLIRDSLEVAGPIQVGGSINVPGITVSGNSIFEQIQVNKSLSVTGDTSLQGQLSVQKNLSVAGSATFGGAVSAPTISVNSINLNGDLTLTKHLVVGGATPDRSNGNALGSGGTTAISGSDSAGSININTGSNAAAGCFLSVTFRQKFNSSPRVQVTPIGAAAAGVGYYVTRTTTGFSVCAANSPPSNSSFGFDYFVIE